MRPRPQAYGRAIRDPAPRARLTRLPHLTDVRFVSFVHSDIPVEVSGENAPDGVSEFLPEMLPKSLLLVEIRYIIRKLNLK